MRAFFIFILREAATILFCLYVGRSSNYTLELSQKSDFQPSTIKSDNIDHPTVQTEQIWLLGLGGFQGGFVFFRKNLISF